jgi:hypothetical protein
MVSYFRYLIVGLVVSFAFVVCAQQDSTPESYTKKVLIEAKWGNELGEFQLGPFEEVRGFSSSMTVDKEGSIYIADIYTCKINVFSPNGNFLYDIQLSNTEFSVRGAMTVDSKVQILYLMVRDNKKARPAIAEINLKTKKVVNSYAIPAGIGAINFYNNMDGGIYVWSRPALRPQTSDLIQGFVPLEKYTAEVNNKNADAILSKSAIVDTGAFTKGLWARGILLNGLKAYVDGVEQKRVIYQNGKGQTKCTVYLLSSIWGSGEKETYITSSNNIAFDYHLNCYQIVGSDEGLKVIKYTPVEVK